MTARPSLIAGAAILALVWVSPLSRLGAHSFTAHMTMHMAIVAMAAPLIALGIAGGRCDPVVRRAGLFAAIPASLIELIVVWLWHAPDLHEAARHRPVMFIAEQASFLGAGLYFWLSVLGGDASRRIAQTGSAVVGLALTFAHMTLLGALLALARRPLYSHGEPAIAIADQQLGGAIMLTIGGVVYIGAGVWMGRRLVSNPPHRTPHRRGGTLVPPDHKPVATP